MDNKKTIGVGVLAAILSGLLVLGGITLTDDHVYYCENSKVVMQCDKLSSYYGLDNGKCYNSEVGNKLCRTGWLLVINEVQLDTPQNTNTRQWICDTNECVPK